MTSKPKANPSPGMAWGSMAIVSRAPRAGRRVRTTIHDTMKLKNNTKTEVARTKTTVFLITSNPPIMKSISLYHCKLTRDNASIEGMRMEGSKDNHATTIKGKKTAKLM